MKYAEVHQDLLMRMVERHVDQIVLIQHIANNAKLLGASIKTDNRTKLSV